MEENKIKANKTVDVNNVDKKNEKRKFINSDTGSIFFLLSISLVVIIISLLVIQRINFCDKFFLHHVHRNLHRSMSSSFAGASLKHI